MPTTDELKIFSIYVMQKYENSFIPDYFNYPGKLVDMVSFGEYDVLIAINDKNQIVGGILWHKRNDKVTEFFGPFLFTETLKEEISEKLIISCLEAIGKSDSIGLFSKISEEIIQKDFFEEIGSINYYFNNKNFVIPVLFRQLTEDTGAVAWCHSSLMDFLKSSYEKLFLPRKIETVYDMGETVNDYSVLYAQIHRAQSSVVLKPVKFGKDINENIKAHLELLKKENFKNIFFEIDTGLSEQALITPSLLLNGFKPKVVVPCAGKGDIVIFQFI